MNLRNLKITQSIGSIVMASYRSVIGIFCWSKSSTQRCLNELGLQAMFNSRFSIDQICKFCISTLTICFISLLSFFFSISVLLFLDSCYKWRTKMCCSLCSVSGLFILLAVLRIWCYIFYNPSNIQWKRFTSIHIA